MSTTQQTLTDTDSTDFERGDCIVDKSDRPDSEKLILVECPLCRADPDRSRYHFDRHESRPAHFRAEHDACCSQASR